MADANTPLISIIIPCYNTEKYVGEALDSALAQTWRHCEIIVVNDGSTDNSPAILDRYADRFPERVRVIHQDNQGVSHARMAGINASDGEFIVPLDADDRLHPHAIATWLAYQQAHPEFDLIYGPYYTIDTEGQRIRLYDYSVIRAGEAIEGAILPTLLVGNVVMSCAFIRMEALRAVGGYTSDDLTRYVADTIPQPAGFKRHINCEDYFCYLRMALAGYLFGFDPHPLYLYRDIPDSLSKDRQWAYYSQTTILKFLTRQYPEQVAEAWFKGRQMFDARLRQAWQESQAASQSREQQFADMECALREAIIQGQVREAQLADFERQLRHMIEQSQQREALLADLHNQLLSVQAEKNT